MDGWDLMDAITPEQARIAIESGWDMRVGRKLKRTLYLHEHTDAKKTYLRQEGMEDPGICIGIVDSEEIASTIVALWNSNAIYTRAYNEDEYGDG